MTVMLSAASAYVLPHASPALSRYCAAARAPAVLAFAEDAVAPVPPSSEPAEAGAPTTQPAEAAPRIRPLTAISELLRAQSDSEESGRLMVIKVFAPYCAACRAIQAKYKRTAKNNAEIDFFEVDFSKSKPLCKHLGIQSLPTGIIFKDGEMVEHRTLRNKEFQAFMRRLDEVAAGEFPVELDAADDSCDPYWHRAAFDRIDTDGSGFIETPEVEKLLVEVYGSEQPPPFDTSTFLSLVDTDNDGKISFQEFDSFVDDKLMATCR